MCNICFCKRLSAFLLFFAVTMTYCPCAQSQGNARDGFLPVPGYDNLEIAEYPVTVGDYTKFACAFVDAGRFCTNIIDERLPVVHVTFKEAEAYCEWLSRRDSFYAYRLPTNDEWERAAGAMPEFALTNCATMAGLRSVATYAETRSAAGCIDMWGNAWEMTRTPDGTSIRIKGGAFDSTLTECRTSNHMGRADPGRYYDNVGFRLVREKKK